jgi:hypothetical protein
VTGLGASFGVPEGVRRVAARSEGTARIVLVRHGEAVCNVSGVVGGQMGCTGLTDLGRRQVRAVADRLERTGELGVVDALYASVLRYRDGRDFGVGVESRSQPNHAGL